ncbi:hypothetical protein H0H93_001398 [Arthromyces matolae]|nr:hypothetical protein H0H93_001398 [Arthromyces matolae]
MFSLQQEIPIPDSSNFPDSTPSPQSLDSLDPPAPKSTPRFNHKFLPYLRSSLALYLLFLSLTIMTVRATPIPMDHSSALQISRPSNWTIVFDLGSGGNRIHVDYFLHDSDGAPSHQESYFQEIKNQGGLSNFEGRHAEGAEYISPIMELAQKVPQNERKSCPVAIRATGGLRLLKDQKQVDGLLKAVRDKFLKLNGDFKPDLVTVGVIKGEDEALFAWVAMNFLLGKFSHDKTPTVALAEMGGASAQLAFELEARHPQAGGHQIEYSIGTQKYHLFANSILGFGYREARKTVNTHISGKGKGTDGVVFSPCLPPRTSRTFPVAGDSEVTMTGRDKTPDMDSFRSCSIMVDEALKPQLSKLSSISNVLGSEDQHQEMYLISSYYDEIAPLFSGASSDKKPIPFTLSSLKQHARHICNGEFETHYNNNPVFLAKLKKDLTQCMDFTFMAKVLGLYGIKDDKTLDLVQYNVRGNVETKIQWPIGAAVHLASGKLLN